MDIQKTLISIKKSIKKPIAFWVWRNLSGGQTPFYHARRLAKYLAYLEPASFAWFGWKLKLWNRAVDYLLWVGELTHTPALKEKF